MSEDDKALVEWLQQYADDVAHYERGDDASMIGLAWTRIEQLTAEVERLQNALGKVKFLAQVNHDQNDNLNSRGRCDLWRIAECARAALEGKQ